MSRDDRHCWTYTSGAGTAYINPSYEIHYTYIFISHNQFYKGTEITTI